MLAFALLAVILHRANGAAPEELGLAETARPLIRWSGVVFAVGDSGDAGRIAALMAGSSVLYQMHACA